MLNKTTTKACKAIFAFENKNSPFRYLVAIFFRGYFANCIKGAIADPSIHP